MKQTYALIPDQIKSYKALYKGRRFWVFENDFERPYEYTQIQGIIRFCYMTLTLAKSSPQGVGWKMAKLMDA